MNSPGRTPSAKENHLSKLADIQNIPYKFNNYGYFMVFLGLKFASVIAFAFLGPLKTQRNP